MIARPSSHLLQPVSSMTDTVSFDLWRAARVIEAQDILTKTALHRPTLVALAARVIAHDPQMGGVA